MSATINLYRAFRELVPDAPLVVGDVVQTAPGSVVVQLPDGGVVSARGSATVGQRVFVRDGLIEGLAPALPVEVIEV